MEPLTIMINTMTTRCYIPYQPGKYGVGNVDPAGAREFSQKGAARE